MVVAGEVLEDGDQDLEFPDKPPELSPDEMFEVEAQAAEKEVMRLIDMGVLVKPREGQSLENVNTLMLNCITYGRLVWVLFFNWWLCANVFKKKLPSIQNPNYLY